MKNERIENTEDVEEQSSKSLVKNQKGGTDFVELLIMVALIAFVVIVGVTSFGKTVKDKFDSADSSVSDQIKPGAGGNGSW